MRYALGGGVNYGLRSEHGKFLVAHHNQLKFCPIQAKPGLPCHPGPETSGIVYGGSIPAEEQERPGDPRGQVVRARPAHLRQIINPPERYGEAVGH